MALRNTQAQINNMRVGGADGISVYQDNQTDPNVVDGAITNTTFGSQSLEIGDTSAVTAAQSGREDWVVIPSGSSVSARSIASDRSDQNARIQLDGCHVSTSDGSADGDNFQMWQSGFYQQRNGYITHSPDLTTDGWVWPGWRTGGITDVDDRYVIDLQGTTIRSNGVWTFHLGGANRGGHNLNNLSVGDNVGFFSPIGAIDWLGVSFGNGFVPDGTTNLNSAFRFEPQIIDAGETRNFVQDGFFNCDWSRSTTTNQANFSGNIDGSNAAQVPAGVGNDPGDQKIDIHIVDAITNNDIDTAGGLQISTNRAANRAPLNFITSRGFNPIFRNDVDFNDPIRDVVINFGTETIYNGLIAANRANRLPVSTNAGFVRTYETATPFTYTNGSSASGGGNKIPSWMVRINGAELVQGSDRVSNTRAAAFGPYDYFSYEANCYTGANGEVGTITPTGATWTAPFVANTAGDQFVNMAREDALLNNRNLQDITTLTRDVANLEDAYAVGKGAAYGQRLSTFPLYQTTLAEFITTGNLTFLQPGTVPGAAPSLLVSEWGANLFTMCVGANFNLNGRTMSYTNLDTRNLDRTAGPTLGDPIDRTVNINASNGTFNGSGTTDLQFFTIGDGLSFTHTNTLNGVTHDKFNTGNTTFLTTAAPGVTPTRAQIVDINLSTTAQERTDGIDITGWQTTGPAFLSSPSGTVTVTVTAEQAARFQTGGAVTLNILAAQRFTLNVPSAFDGRLAIAHRDGGINGSGAWTIVTGLAGADANGVFDFTGATKPTVNIDSTHAGFTAPDIPAVFTVGEGYLLNRQDITSLGTGAITFDVLPAIDENFGLISGVPIPSGAPTGDILVAQDGTATTGGLRIRISGADDINDNTGILGWTTSETSRYLAACRNDVDYILETIQGQRTNDFIVINGDRSSTIRATGDAGTPGADDTIRFDLAPGTTTQQFIQGVTREGSSAEIDVERSSSDTNCRMIIIYPRQEGITSGQLTNAVDSSITGATVASLPGDITAARDAINLHTTGNISTIESDLEIINNTNLQRLNDNVRIASVKPGAVQTAQGGTADLTDL